jgi:hypothetical protein
MNLRFAFEKETRGAVRFQEVGEDAKPAFAPSVGTLYIRKAALPDGKIPQTLTVTITLGQSAP